MSEHMRSKILLVDDEASILNVLSTILKAEDYDVVPVLDGEKAKEIINSDIFDLMLCDIRMSPVDGMQLLKLARERRPLMSVIMLTAYGTVETAIEALKVGAFDYVTKPFKVDELLIIVKRALDYGRALSENKDLKAQLGIRYQLENIVAESPAMQHVCEMIRKVAPTDTTILIYGESGTGKEVVAKAIHACSSRKNERFLAVNCAALPEPLLESEMFGHVKGSFTGASANKDGLFEAANGGTIFLDEIGSMPLSIQGKLLRVLQEKEVRKVGSNKDVSIDTRVIAATNTKLEILIEKGAFREDLYYRLSVIPIEIKALRERREDIMPLIYHIIRQESNEMSPQYMLESDACNVLEAYSWPGNVRELENAIKHAMTFARDGKITRDVLPLKIANTPFDPGKAVSGNEFRAMSLKAFLREKEKEYLHQVLKFTAGDKERAARTLDVSLATLYRKLTDDESGTD